MLFKNLFRNKKGAALVEYGLLIGGVTLMSAAAVAVFGHKTNDLIAATASVMPGAHADDNAPIVSGKIIETAQNTGGDISLNIGDAATAGSIVANTGSERLGNNMGVAGLTTLVVEAADTTP